MQDFTYEELKNYKHIAKLYPDNEFTFGADLNTSGFYMQARLLGHCKNRYDLAKMFALMFGEVPVIKPIVDRMLEQCENGVYFEVFPNDFYERPWQEWDEIDEKEGRCEWAVKDYCPGILCAQINVTKNFPQKEYFENLKKFSTKC